MSAPTVFKVGDVVRLKSGGMSMTVERVATEEAQEIHCVWSGWSESLWSFGAPVQTLQRHRFPAEALEWVPARPANGEGTS